MANGTAKAIQDVRPGEMVLATDPTTGKTEKRKVTDLIVGHGEKNLVEITVDVDGHRGTKTAAVTATAGHPFWVPDLKTWVNATDVQAGSLLQTAAGTSKQITAIKRWITQAQQVYNVTVEGLHTYYVMAGNTPVLVHNCGGDTPAPSMADKPLGPARPDANPLQGTRYTEKVQEQIKSGDDHGFPAQIDTLPTMRDTSMVSGGDGIPRLHVKLPGSVNGSKGTFHWIIERDGSINHRFFDRRMK